MHPSYLSDSAQLSSNHSSRPEVLEPALSLDELAGQLGVKVQALYDLRCQGRGPTGFRVGRQLRFRRSEIEAWLARLEAEDAQRHPGRAQ